MKQRSRFAGLVVLLMGFMSQFGYLGRQCCNFPAAKADRVVE